MWAMETADRLELHELPGRYGDAIDDRDWEALGRIFTEDATFDLTDLGGPKLVGLAEIRRFMDEDATHPLTHLMTNIYVDEQPAGRSCPSASWPGRRAACSAPPRT